MSTNAWLRRLSQQRKEKMLIAAEVREINSDEEFQRRYGVSDVEMVALKAAWYQVELPLCILELVVAAGALTGFLLIVISLILKALL